jgi:hypothetical protein
MRPGTLIGKADHFADNLPILPDLDRGTGAAWGKEFAGWAILPIAMWKYDCLARCPS